MYNNKIWYNVIFIYVGHMIFNRPLMFDMDVTLWGKSNIYTSTIMGNRSSWFQVNQNPNSKEKNHSLIIPKKIQMEIINGTQIIIQVAWEVTKRISRDDSSCGDSYHHQVCWCVSQESLGSIVTNVKYPARYWFGTGFHPDQLATLSDKPNGKYWITKVSWQVIEKRVHTRELEPLHGPRTIYAKERWHMMNVCE